MSILKGGRIWISDPKIRQMHSHTFLFLNEIEIEKPDGSTESVPYDVLAIATGGAYTAPWRADADKLASLEDRAKECEEFRKQVLDE